MQPWGMGAMQCVITGAIQCVIAGAIHWLLFRLPVGVQHVQPHRKSRTLRLSLVPIPLPMSQVNLTGPKRPSLAIGAPWQPCLCVPHCVHGHTLTRPAAASGLSRCKHGTSIPLQGTT